MNEGGERICIRFDGRLDTAYYSLNIADVTQRSCESTAMETLLGNFVYRTPSRKKGSVTTFTGPIYMGCFLNEEHLFVRHTSHVPLVCVPCEPPVLLICQIF